MVTQLFVKSETQPVQPKTDRNIMKDADVGRGL